MCGFARAFSPAASLCAPRRPASWRPRPSSRRNLRPPTARATARPISSVSKTSTTGKPSAAGSRSWPRRSIFRSQRPRPVEIVDCAALIRYAYREALRLHDGRWACDAGLPIVAGLESVEKYRYPYTPLGAALFRVRPGPFRPQDLSDGSFAQFSDARTLLRFNTHSIGRNLSGALPGDLLFFEPAADQFHRMLFLGPSQIDSGRALRPLSQDKWAAHRSRLVITGTCVQFPRYANVSECAESRPYRGGESPLSWRRVALIVAESAFAYVCKPLSN